MALGKFAGALFCSWPSVSTETLTGLSLCLLCLGWNGFPAPASTSLEARCENASAVKGKECPAVSRDGLFLSTSIQSGRIEKGAMQIFCGRDLLLSFSGEMEA